MLNRVRSAGPATIVWLGPLACGAGLLAYRMGQALPWSRFAESLTLALAAAALAALLRRLRGWHWAWARSPSRCAWR